MKSNKLYSYCKLLLRILNKLVINILMLDFKDKLNKIDL